MGASDNTLRGDLIFMTNLGLGYQREQFATAQTKPRGLRPRHHTTASSKYHDDNDGKSSYSAVSAAAATISDDEERERELSRWQFLSTVPDTDVVEEDSEEYNGGGECEGEEGQIRVVGLGSKSSVDGTRFNEL